MKSQDIENKQLKDTIRQLRQELDNLNTRLTLLFETKLTQLRAQNNELRNTIIKQRLELEKLSIDSLNDLEKLKSNKKEEIMQLEATIIEMRHTLAEMNRKYIEKTSNDLNLFQREKNQLIETIKTLRQRLEYKDAK